MSTEIIIIFPLHQTPMADFWRHVVIWKDADSSVVEYEIAKCVLKSWIRARG